MARTRIESPYSRMKPAASLCSYTSSSPNVTNRSSYSACSLSRPMTATEPLYRRRATRAGDALLRDGDEGVVRLAFRRPPAALVHDVRVPRRDEVLGRERATIEHELLELTVRGVEQGTARRLVDAARLHADHAILDEVDAADAVTPADRVQLRR